MIQPALTFARSNGHLQRGGLVARQAWSGLIKSNPVQSSPIEGGQLKGLERDLHLLVRKRDKWVETKSKSIKKKT